VTESALLISLFTIPALAAVAEYARGKQHPGSAGRFAILGAAISFGLAIAIAGRVLHGGRLMILHGQLYADGLAGLMALVVSLVGLVTTVYAYPYLRHEVAEGKVPVERLPIYFVLTSIFISTMTAVTVTNNIIMMYVLVEATTLASALLVTYYGLPESLEAGYKYLLLCSVGIIVGLLGCVVFYSAAVPFLGGSRAMLISEIATVAGRFPPAVSLVGGALVIIGFGSKAGFVPFHAWLPDAHSQSPSPMSALLSGVTIKVAVFAVARIASIAFPAHDILKTYCVVLGAVTMLVGIFCAFAQTDLKRMLAYSSVSQMGYIIMGLGVASYLGYYGAIYHLFNHALDKAMLFLCTGVMLYSCDTTDIRKLGQRKHSRVLAVCFFIGAFAISGLPPLNGFWSKFTIYVAAAQARLWWAFGIALFTSLLTLAVLVRAGYMIFLQQEHGGAEHQAVAAASALAFAAGAGASFAAATKAPSGVQASPRSTDAAPGSKALPDAKSCPPAIMAVIVVMTLLIVISGLNLNVMNRLIDLAARALLH
jgi:hydrogenase-4 component F